MKKEIDDYLNVILLLSIAFLLVACGMYIFKLDANNYEIKNKLGQMTSVDQQHSNAINAIQNNPIFLNYDPNDVAYKFLAPIPADWSELVGESERTRIIYNISEMRVLMKQMSQRLLALEPNEVNDVAP